MPFPDNSLASASTEFFQNNVQYNPDGSVRLQSAGDVDMQGQYRFTTDGLQVPGRTSLKVTTKRTPPTVITTFQSGHGYFSSLAAGGSANVNYSTDYLNGSQCVQLVSDGAGGNNYIKKNSISPTIDWTGKQPRIWVKFPTPSDINNVQTLSVYISSDNVVANFWTAEFGNLNTYPNWLSAEGDWCGVTIPWGALAANTTGTPSIAASNAIWLKLIDKNSSPVTVLFGGIEQVAQPANGVVSFTFDDGLSTVFSNARSKLSQYRYPATAYIIADVIGGSSVNGDGTGYMTLQNLSDLQEKHGWEIGAHAYKVANHNLTNGFTDMAASALERELVGIRTWLQSNGFNSSDHLALPRGYHNATTAPLTRKYFLSTRTTWHPTLSETFPPADPNKLRIFYVLNSTSTASVQTAIDRAFTNKEWLILLFHDITSGSASGSTQYTTTNFGTIVDYVNSKGIAVRTVGDVIQNGV